MFSISGLTYNSTKIFVGLISRTYGNRDVLSVMIGQNTGSKLCAAARVYIYGTVVVTRTGAKYRTASAAEMTTEMQEKRGAAGRSPSPDARAILPATAVSTDPAEPRSSTPFTLGKRTPLSFSRRTSRVSTIIPHGSPISHSDLVESEERIYLRYLSPADMYPDASASHGIYLPPALRMHAFPLSNVTSSAVGRAALAQVPGMFRA